MISLSHVSKRYPGGREALHDVGFNIDSGELAFITGHSGAGKTTLLKLLVAIERPTAGSIIVNGQNVGSLQARAVPFLRRKFGLIFQDHKLLFDRSVFDNVALPLDIAGYGAKDAGRRVRAALDKVGLLKYEKALPITLSGGEQQRLCIARAIAVDPEVILMDEPCSALDPIATAKIEELIHELKGRYAIVVVTHNMQQAARVSQRTAFFHLGQLVEYGQTSDIFTNPREERTRDYITGRYG